MPIAAVILAAGQGTRFKSETAKVLHPLLGKPMVRYPLELAQTLNLSPIVVVVGHQAEAVAAACRGEAVRFAHQPVQNGTGQAVIAAREALAGFEGEVLILSGDVPLLTPKTVTDFIAAHQQARAAVSFMSAVVDDPSGYGRVVERPGGFMIVEDRDATAKEREIDEINAGLYLARADFLFEALSGLSADNAQGEYYLPDVVGLAAERGLGCVRYLVGDAEEVRGVNDRWQLAQAERRLRLARLKALALAGVSFQNPETTYLEYRVTIGPDSVIGAGVHLLGRTEIGRGVAIGPDCYLKDVVVGDGAKIGFGNCLINQSIEAGRVIEPRR